MIDLKVLADSSKPGPRYTSYPPANMFDSRTGPDSYRECLAASTRDLSIYVHLPFCERACSFCGCNVIYTRNHGKVAPYLNLLEKELQLISRTMKPGKQIKQIHLGGGTPTFLSSFEIRYLMGILERYFPISDDAERSVELDPRVTSRGHIEALASCGFKRGSIGVQDIDPDVQKAVNRVQSAPLIEAAVRTLRESGFTSLNVDLIYGLPLQTRASVEKTIEFVIGLRPERISFFNFAYIPQMKPHQRIIRPDTLPSASERLTILQSAVELFTKAGYEFVGMDHFALKNDELARAQREGRLHRNFQGYTTASDLDLIGLGVSSIGEVSDAYFQNHKTMDQYSQAIEAGVLATERGHVLSEDDRIRRDVIRQLMCYARLDYKKFEREYRIDFRHYFADELKSLADFQPEGIVREQTDGLTLSEEGRFLVRNVAMVFDKYSSSVPTAFSRTV